RRLNDPFTVRFVRKTMQQAAAVITVSEELRQRAIALGVPPGKITTILNGCDTSMFYPGDRDEARREIGYEHGGELILYAGNVIESKGSGELIGAFVELAAARPETRLAVIGNGDYAGTLVSRAAAAGVQDRVLMLGRRKSAEVAQ